MCHEKWILYGSWWSLAQWLDCEGAANHFSQPNLHQKMSWSMFAVCCLSIRYSFLNLGETITSAKYVQQIDEKHCKLQCLQPALINRKGPVLFHNNTWPHIVQPMLQKLNELFYKVGLICHIHLTSCQQATASSTATTFCRENASTTSRRQKMLSKN